MVISSTSARLDANKEQRRGEALKVNISAGEGLQDVLKSNLGPLGTIKMQVTSSSVADIPANKP